jgi:hypothetical protein
MATPQLERGVIDLRKITIMSTIRNMAELGNKSN